jgi:hypothetical protein
MPTPMRSQNAGFAARPTSTGFSGVGVSRTGMATVSSSTATWNPSAAIRIQARSRRGRAAATLRQVPVP